MQPTDLRQLELDTLESPLDERFRVHFTFPTHAAAGSASTSIVYFEIEPGDHLATHLDSAEETLLILEGTGDAWIGDVHVTVEKEQYVIVPANEPHGIRNIGDGPLRVIGFFTSNTVVSIFDEVLDEPQVFVAGGPFPIAVPLREGAPATA